MRSSLILLNTLTGCVSSLDQQLRVPMPMSYPLGKINGENLDSRFWHARLSIGRSLKVKLELNYDMAVDSLANKYCFL